MVRPPLSFGAITTLLLAVACGGGGPQEPPAEAPTSDAVLYEGFRLITGDERAPVEGAAFLVDDGVIQAVGLRGELGLPAGAARVDLSGKTVMPALVSLHGHPGFQIGLTFEAENYTRETVSDHLDRYAYYGVGTIVSLGTDGGDLVYEIKRDQADGTLGGARLLTAGSGIARPNAGPGAPALRPSAIGVDTEEEARAAVQDLASRGVDVVKIWVDDRGGSVAKLSPELSAAVIDEAHVRDLKVIAHIFNVADAAELVEMGVDGFAHLGRDEEMSSELVAAIARRGVFVMPNLGISERFTYTEPPEFVDDPLLHESITPDVIERFKESVRNRSAEAAANSLESWGYMQASLPKLKEAGVTIVLGADSGGVVDWFMGYTELRELELMVNGGLTPNEAIMASTSVSANTLGIDAGLLTAGKSADFIVLDANPLDDIANARQIDRVFLKGSEVDREGLRRRWTGR
jgi:imidazolonepropionase-like amidohydrolase